MASSPVSATPVLNFRRLIQITDDIEALPQHLQCWGLIPAEGAYKCPTCGNSLKLQKSSSSIDGWMWQCNHKVSIRKQKSQKCGTRVQFRTGTFFSRSKLSLLQILGFVHFWMQYVPLTQISYELELSECTAVNWSAFCRQVCLEYLLRQPIKLGGSGNVVEIDEAKFEQCDDTDRHLVFGCYERDTGRMFMIAQKQGTTDTLLPIIEQWIEPETTIVSNYWKTHNVLLQDGYEQLKVNRSIIFKYPDVGTHTNSVEASRRAAKASMTASGSPIKERAPGDLARYLLFRRCRDLHLGTTLEFFRLAGKMYNPTACREDLGEERSDEEMDREF